MLRNPSFLVGATVLALSFAAAGPAQAGIMEVDTDTSWKVLGGTAPAAGWNTDPNFDDSAWSAASIRRNRDLGGETVSSIWAATGTNPVWMRKEFFLSGTITAATLYSVIDDDADVYLNGNLIISDHNGVMQFDPPLDVTSFLNTGGMNLLAVNIVDNQNGQNGDFGARLVITGAVPQPASVILVGTGMLGLLGYSKRRQANHRTA